MRLAKFIRPNGSLVKAHLNDEQARRVLTSDGYKKYISGKVLNPSDYSDSVYLNASASASQKPLIDGVKPVHNLGISDEHKIAVFSVLALGALAFMGKKYSDGR